ncbi:MAG: histidine phosphatase family protein [Candidatus Micrarchaeota archaeon]
MGIAASALAQVAQRTENPKSVRLHLVRHGQTMANVQSRFPGPEARLTNVGRAQAMGIGREFLKKDILVDSILVSPTARTFETMENACLVMPVQPRVIVVSGLAEKDPCGAIGERIPGTFEEVDRLTIKRGGESFPWFIERVENAFIGLLRDIREGRIPGGDIAVFGHSLVNRICLGVLQGVGGTKGLEGQSQLNGGIKTVEIRRA